MNTRESYSRAKRAGKTAWMEAQIAEQLADDSDECVVVVHPGRSECRRHNREWPHPTLNGGPDGRG